MNNDLYIACLNLAGKTGLVVGGGPVGLEKARGLLDARARVIVVAPEATDEIRNLSESGVLEWRTRPYERADLDGCFLVIAATSVESLNRRVHADAEARSMLVNVADVPDLCNFILPAIAREGPVAIAVSTAGASPALAQRMRREAGEALGRPYAELAELLAELRPWAKANLPTYRDRKAFFDDIVEGDPDPIALLREGKSEAVRALVKRARERHLPVRLRE
jgi:precorrin-2 dehydrogenase/sirohydrochlorin ferrochelatase